MDNFSTVIKIRYIAFPHGTYCASRVGVGSCESQFSRDL